MVSLGVVLHGLMLAFPERLKVPASIGHLASGTFVLAGLLALANVFCSRKVRAWLTVALLTCMLLPAVWISFGAGPRTCSFKLGLLSGGLTDGGACRVAFGVGSVLGLVLVIVALRHAMKGAEENG